VGSIRQSAEWRYRNGTDRLMMIGAASSKVFMKMRREQSRSRHDYHGTRVVGFPMDAAGLARIGSSDDKYLLKSHKTCRGDVHACPLHHPAWSCRSVSLKQVVPPRWLAVFRPVAFSAPSWRYSPVPRRDRRGNNSRDNMLKHICEKRG